MIMMSFDGQRIDVEIEFWRHSAMAEEVYCVRARKLYKPMSII